MTVYYNNSQNQKNNGFTIVELLVVVIIMVIMGIIFTDILVESLRSRNKVAVINQVKQNGQVVLDKLSNEIRSAEKVVCVDKFNTGGTPKDTIVIFNSGTYSQFRLIQPTASANGEMHKVNFIRSDLVEGTLDSDLCTTVDITTGTNLIQSLTDTDTKNGVSVDIPPSPQNIFEQRGDNVIIKFNASAGISAGFAYDVTVKDGGIPFMTSVQVRGIKR